MIENIDDNFGVFMKKMKEWGALENTLIVFTTDNGAPHKPDSPNFNGGYKTGKGSPYEGGVHVPSFWYWRNVLPEGGKTDALTAHIDMFSTFCELAGVTIPNNIQKLDGRSVVPILENIDKKMKDRMLFTHSGRWDKGAKPNPDGPWAVRTKRWRLVGDELYDISNDPFEKENVAAQNPKVVKKLETAYKKWWNQVIPYMINENRECELEEPLAVRYYKQKEKVGIPFWMPEVETLHHLK